MSEDNLDRPRSLRATEAIVARRSKLGEPHVRPLTDYVVRLRAEYPGYEFPDFDPLDGGVNADILFLLEKPGPMTSARGTGSGFISRNNDDPTAEATFDFLIRAKLPRNRTVFWNIIPGWNGTRKIANQELREGLKALADVIRLLPKVKTVVLVGRTAQRATTFLESMGLVVVPSPHPSPIVRATDRAAWDGIPAKWASVGSISPRT